jgi:hypothetical protein
MNMHANVHPFDLHVHVYDIDKLHLRAKTWYYSSIVILSWAHQVLWLD